MLEKPDMIEILSRGPTLPLDGPARTQGYFSPSPKPRKMPWEQGKLISWMKFLPPAQIIDNDHVCSFCSSFLTLTAYSVLLSELSPANCTLGKTKDKHDGGSCGTPGQYRSLRDSHTRSGSKSFNILIAFTAAYKTRMNREYKFCSYMKYQGWTEYRVWPDIGPNYVIITLSGFWSDIRNIFWRVNVS